MLLIATQAIEESESLSGFLGATIMRYRWWVVGLVAALIVFNAFRLHIQNRMKEEEKKPNEYLPK